jgi:hypothetical protein
MGASGETTRAFSESPKQGLVKVALNPSMMLNLESRTPLGQRNPRPGSREFPKYLRSSPNHSKRDANHWALLAILP